MATPAASPKPASTEELRASLIYLAKQKKVAVPEVVRVALYALAKYRFDKATTVLVTDFADVLGIAQPNVSESLTALKRLDLWATKMVGRKKERRLLSSAERLARLKKRKEKKKE